VPLLHGPSSARRIFAFEKQSRNRLCVPLFHQNLYLPYSRTWPTMASFSRSFWVIYAVCRTNLVIFQGFEVFSRSNPIWQNDPALWDFTIAPWVAIGCFTILVFSWLARRRLYQGVWSWDMKRLSQCRLHDGIAPFVEPDDQPSNKFMRALNAILNFI
jgi:hypothetical protein